MADRLHSRFEWTDWRRRLDDIAGISAVAEPAEQAFLLRGFHDLMAHLPAHLLDPLLLDGVALPRAAAWERTLDCGAYETAALAFIGPRTGCMISRGSEGFHLVSIALPGRDAEVSASGATLALAVLAALASAIGNLTPAAPVLARETIHGSHLLH
ncbi:MAG: hypothetical protein KGN34_11095 [Sphingomonadales bacterium]|nr:hypothetical protein [Sphingomonadales bacterium]